MRRCLIEPKVDTDPVAYRHTLFLSSLLLILMLGGLSSIAIQLFVVPGFEETFLGLLGIIGLLGGCYLLARLGFYKMACWATVLLTFSGCMFAMFFDPNQSAPLPFFLIPVVIAAAFLPLSQVLLVCALVLGGVLFGMSFESAEVQDSLMPQVIALALISSLSLVILYYRQQLEALRVDVYARAETKKFDRALQQSADAVMITDVAGMIEYVNPAFEAMTGYQAREMQGKPAKQFKSGEHSKAFYKQLWKTIYAGQPFNEVFLNKRRDGTHYYEDQTISPLKDEQGNITHFVATGRDISDRMETQARLDYLAHHDVLTQIPNRSHFLDLFRQALARARRHEIPLALMFLDLDHFKRINDSLGHEAGDELLLGFCKRIKAVLREEDIFARFGGDEFVLLFENFGERAGANRLAEKLLAAVSEPFTLHDQEFFVGVSIGISLFPEDGEDSQSLMQHADTAMYHSKTTGRNQYQYYAAEMTNQAHRRISLESLLRRALEQEQFELYYQPIVDAGEGTVRCAEALLRWNHPQDGLVGPAQFIPLLEDTGLIVPVGEWLLHQACQQAQAWRERPGNEQFCIAVNLSSRQLEDDGFVSKVDRVLAETGLDPTALKLEVTESMLMQNLDSGLAMMQALADRGIQLAIDDFGTGYSSLSHLKRMPINILKIDRSFVKDILEDPNDRAIVQATLAMAESLHLDVVAEGVESAHHGHFLEQMGCRFLQGFYFSQPLPAQEFDFNVSFAYR